MARAIEPRVQAMYSSTVTLSQSGMSSAVQLPSFVDGKGECSVHSFCRSSHVPSCEAAPVRAEIAQEPASIFFKSASAIVSLIWLQIASACASVSIAESLVPFGAGVEALPAEPVPLPVEPAPPLFPLPAAGAPALCGPAPALCELEPALSPSSGLPGLSVEPQASKD